FAQQQNLPLVDGTRVVMAFVLKPLNKNIAIGFFGGDWAKALEKRCENLVYGSGKSNPQCDDVSIAITKSALANMSGEKRIDDDIEPGESRQHTGAWTQPRSALTRWRSPEAGTYARCWLSRWRTRMGSGGCFSREKAPAVRSITVLIPVRTSRA